MKIAFVLPALLFAVVGYSQPMGYDIYGTLTNPRSGPYPVITLDTLKEARTLNDIYARYPSSWVSSYISTTLSTTCGKVVKKATGTNAVLTAEQKRILEMADEGCRIDVVVDYIPENNLKDNPPRKMNFTMRVVPIVEAKYPGGIETLKAYLKENVVDKTSSPAELVKVKFNINAGGLVCDTQVITSSNDDSTDNLILEALCNMPKWSPAENANGSKIIQEFEFSMGTAMLMCNYYEY